MFHEREGHPGWAGCCHHKALRGCGTWGSVRAFAR